MLTMTSMDIRLEDIHGLPEGVEGWRVEMGSDATGDPAVWVWLSVEDDVLDKMDSKARESIRDIVTSGIQKKLIGQYGTSVPWVYVRFRGVSEGT